MVTNASESARDVKTLFDQASKLLSNMIQLLLQLALQFLEFLKMCPLIDHPFYKAVFNTQMFINFVEQRSFSYSSDATLAFFDECTEKVIVFYCDINDLALLLQLCQDYQARLIKPLAESQR